MGGDLTSPRGILEQRDVDCAGGQVDVSHDGTADEHVLDGAEVGVPQLLVDRDVVELDVEVLVDRLEGARHLDVVLELDGDGLVDEGLEEAMFFTSRFALVGGPCLGYAVDFWGLDGEP